MEKDRLQHTIDIFERMYANMPPLVPEKIRTKMSEALKLAKKNLELTEEELETTMVLFAKQVWPYNQAFQEFYNSYEAQMGEQMFTQKLTGMLRKRYQDYVDSGSDFATLQKKSSDFFTSEERTKLHAIIVDITCEIRAFAFQAVMHRDKEAYLDKIDEFKEILSHIDEQLDDLRAVADEESEHPMLAHEIRDHVRGFEHSFAFLGPRVDYNAVCSAREHFKGRKKHYKIRVKHRDSR